MNPDGDLDLGDHCADFVYRQVRAGRYGSASEVVRAGLQLLEERELRLEVLRRALQEGEASGPAEYSLDDLIAELDAEAEG
jgi:antitoxin ParD1/3/4